MNKIEDLYNKCLDEAKRYPDEVDLSLPPEKVTVDVYKSGMYFFDLPENDSRLWDDVILTTFNYLDKDAKEDQGVSDD